MDLWADLQAVTKQRFENAIEKKVAEKKKRPPTPRTAPDRPAPRIARLMLEECALSPQSAVEALRAQLAIQGISDARIPALHGTDFEAWLSKLFKTVPASRVLHAAVVLSYRADT